MEKEIIYAKKYPRIRLCSDLNCSETNRPIPPFEKVLARLQQRGSQFVHLESKKTRDEFVRLAIEFSEQYQLDTVIQQFMDRISVSYSFDCGGAMQGLGKVFSIADEVAFFKDIHGFDITVILDYYTHR